MVVVMHMGSAEVRTPLIELLDARLAAMEAKSEARHKDLKRMCRYLFGILNKVLDNPGVSPAPCITVD